MVVQQIGLGVQLLFDVRTNLPMEQVRPGLLKERLLLLSMPQGLRVYERSHSAPGE